MNWPSKIAIVMSVLLLAGCAGTTVPKPTVDTTPSWDGGTQNSGFIGYTAVGSGIITPNARERYNGLIAIYSKRFLPPLTPDAGLLSRGSNWEIDPEHLVKFRTMNRWRKSGL